MFINGFNLGRYWTTAGPQETLYIPANLLYSGQHPSTIVILELDDDPCDFPDTCFVTFQETPILNGPVKPLTYGRHAILESSEPWVAKYAQQWDSIENKADGLLKKIFKGIHRKIV